MDINKDLIAASSTPIVLAILAEEDSYGYAIIKRVREASEGRMEWTDGMLYPVLHRLERLGYARARWGTAESGRRRKYYRITAQGRAQLAEERRQWQAVDATLRGIWQGFVFPAPQCPPAPLRLRAFLWAFAFRLKKIQAQGSHRLRRSLEEMKRCTSPRSAPMVRRAPFRTSSGTAAHHEGYPDTGGARRDLMVSSFAGRLSGEASVEPRGLGLTIFGGAAFSAPLLQGA